MDTHSVEEKIRLAKADEMNLYWIVSESGELYLDAENDCEIKEQLKRDYPNLTVHRIFRLVEETTT